MEKELHEKLIEVLSASMEAVKETKDFATEQAPIVVEQILKYEAFSHTIWFWFWAVLAVLFFIVSFFTIDEGVVLFPLVGVCFSFFSVLNKISLWKIENAPNLYILEYLRDQIVAVQ